MGTEEKCALMLFLREKQQQNRRTCQVINQHKQSFGYYSMVLSSWLSVCCSYLFSFLLSFFLSFVCVLFLFCNTVFSFIPFFFFFLRLSSTLSIFIFFLLFHKALAKPTVHSNVNSRIGSLEKTSKYIFKMYKQIDGWMNE